MLNKIKSNSKVKKLFGENGVKVAYLFGSSATGTRGVSSDIDIGVIVDPNIAEETYFDLKISLLTELIRLLEKNEVDLVIINEAPPLLRYQIISQGKLIICEDESLRVKEEVRALRDYFDLDELQRIQRKYFIERIKSGRFAEL